MSEPYAWRPCVHGPKISEFSALIRAARSQGKIGEAILHCYDRMWLRWAVWSVAWWRGWTRLGDPKIIGLHSLGGTFPQFHIDVISRGCVMCELRASVNGAAGFAAPNTRSS